MHKKNILIADGQALTAAGLRYLLSAADAFEVNEVSTRMQLLKELQQNPELLIIDYKQVAGFHIKDFRLLKEEHPLTNILVISADTDKETLLRILESEVAGFLTKECSKEDIMHAVHAILKGEKFYCQKVFHVLMEIHRKKENSDCQPTNLTLRETQIIKLIAEGNATSDIAEKLHVSHHTINSHRKSILKKLNIKSPIQLVIYAIDTGLIKLK